MTATTGVPAPRLPGTPSLAASRARIEIKQFFRGRDAVVFSLALPAVMMVLFASIFKGTVQGAGNVTVAQLYVSGMIGAGIMSTAFSSLAINIAGERDDGTLRRLRGVPMPRSAYFLGKVGLVLVTGLLETALLLAVGTAFYGLDLPHSPGKWLTFGWVLLLGLMASTLLGIAASSVPRNAKSAAAVIQLPFLVLQFVSGVFIPITTLPSGILSFGAVFPLKWMCQGFRAVFLPDSAKVLEAAGGWEYGRIALVLGAWCLAGLVLCLTTFRWRGRRDG